MGTVFVIAAYQKLIQPGEFLRAIYGYELVGPPLAKWIASVLPGIEAVAGIALITGLTRGAALRIAQALLVLFILAQLTVMSRGLNADCGCGFAGDDDIGYRSLLRTSGLLLVSFCGTFVWLGGRLKRPTYSADTRM